LQTAYGCIICTFRIVAGRPIGVGVKRSRNIAQARQDFFEAVNFQQFGRLASKAADVKVSTRGKQLAPKQDQTRE